MNQLLPVISSSTEYKGIHQNITTWLPAMRVICQRHGLASDQLVRLSEGTNVVFAAGERYIIKLYPPYWLREFNADRTVGEYVHGKLGVTTPEMHAHGMLEDWPYLVMSRLTGTYLADIWDTLEPANQLSIIIEIAEMVVRLHALSPTDQLLVLEGNWSAFVEKRVNACVQRQREQGLSEDWLQQLPAYLAKAAPLYPQDFTPAIVSGDIHHYHLLVSQEQRRWRLSGFFDFDDARVGFYEYDIASAGLFMMANRPALLRTFLLTYGYAEEAINEQLKNRLMSYTLLHPYRPLNWIREEFAKQPCSTLEELANMFYGLG